MRPVIALLSDFGTRDHYAGTMKAVMIGICPDITLVDITHEITPHDVLDGALQAGRRGGRLSLRRAGQRPAERRFPRCAAQARCRADGAAVRAADGQPD